MAGELLTTLTAERLREVLDYDPLTGMFTWKVRRNKQSAGSIAGSPDRQGHIRIGIDGRDYAAHRLAWLYVHGEWPPNDIDHKDRIKGRNALANLRPGTRSQNNANSKRRRDNLSGYKGVHFHKASGLWLAHIRKDGKRTSLGYFSTAQQAHEAYMAAATRLFGEFANDGQVSA